MVPTTQDQRVPIKFYSAEFFFHFLFCCDFFALRFEGPHHLGPKGPYQFFIPLLHSAITFLYLDLKVPPNKTQGFPLIFIPLIFVLIIILLIFIPLFFPLWLFCSYIWRSPSPKTSGFPLSFILLILFCCDLFALRWCLRPEDPHQFFFHWFLFCFYSTDFHYTFLFCCDLFALKCCLRPKSPHQFLFCWLLLHFYSADFYSTFYSAVTFLHLD